MSESPEYQRGVLDGLRSAQVTVEGHPGASATIAEMVKITEAYQKKARTVAYVTWDEGTISAPSFLTIEMEDGTRFTFSGRKARKLHAQFHSLHSGDELNTSML